MKITKKDKTMKQEIVQLITLWQAIERRRDAIDWDEVDDLMLMILSVMAAKAFDSPEELHIALDNFTAEIILESTEAVA